MTNLDDKQKDLTEKLLRIHHNHFFKKMAKELNAEDIHTFTTECLLSIASLMAGVTEIICRDYNLSRDGIALKLLHLYSASLRNFNALDDKEIH